MALSIGRAIKTLREANGKTLGALATEARLSVPYLSLVESDKRNPSVDSIRRIAKALDVPIDVFLLVSSGADSSLTTECDTTSRLVAILRDMEDLHHRIKDAVREKKGE